MSNYQDQSSAWKQTQNGSEFCQWDNLPENIRSQLKQEDKFTLTIDSIRHTVKDYDGRWLVFRRNVGADTKTKSSMSYDNGIHNISEIKIMSLSEANDCLQSEKPEYRIFGSDPVKIINNEAYVAMAKRKRIHSFIHGGTNG